jgi:DNA-binding transcriptional LysR family regulator
MNITLKQLKIFVSVAQTCSVTASAKIIHLSQPAISISLNELEKQLNCKLFYRHNNRLILSENGKILLPYADEIICRLQNISTVFSSDQRGVTQINIGASKTIGSYLLPYLLADFRKNHPQTQQKFIINNTRTLCESLLNFEIDIALIEGQNADPTLTTIPWLEDEMVIICSKKNKLAKSKAFNFKNLKNCQWIVREIGSGTREYFEQQIAGNVVQPHIAFELNSTEAIINSVTAGLGLSCLSKYSITKELKSKDISVLKLKLPPRQYSLIYHSQKFENQLLKAFILFCKKWLPKKSG